jgi:hypothetical protein
MEAGELDLKAWGIGLSPQAQIRFNNDLVLKDTYVPIFSLLRQGTKVAAYRCKACQLISFRYPGLPRGSK